MICFYSCWVTGCGSPRSLSALGVGGLLCSAIPADGKCCLIVAQTGLELVTLVPPLSSRIPALTCISLMANAAKHLSTCLGLTLYLLQGNYSIWLFSKYSHPLNVAF